MRIYGISSIKVRFTVCRLKKYYLFKDKDKKLLISKKNYDEIITFL